VLALDDKGIPGTVDRRLEIIRQLAARTREGGLPDRNLYIDPLVTTIATDIESGNNAFNAMRRIKEEFPDVHITAGLSNISFGLPVRSVINQAFVALALAAGMDSAILDPQDRNLRSIIYAAEMVLGRDRYCMNYTRAYRAGKIRGEGTQH
jgi:5-methyltetrahydrofolate--homocysteine methyltransferase